MPAPSSAPTPDRKKLTRGVYVQMTAPVAASRAHTASVLVVRYMRRPTTTGKVSQVNWPNPSSRRQATRRRLTVVVLICASGAKRVLSEVPPNSGQSTVAAGSAGVALRRGYALTSGPSPCARERGDADHGLPPYACGNRAWG